MMFDKYFTSEQFVVEDDGTVVFHEILTRLPIGNIRPGSRFTYASVDLLKSTITFSNKNEELEDDDDEITFGSFPLTVMIESPSWISRLRKSLTPTLPSASVPARQSK